MYANEWTVMTFRLFFSSVSRRRNLSAFMWRATTPDVGSWNIHSRIKEYAEEEDEYFPFSLFEHFRKSGSKQCCYTHTHTHTWIKNIQHQFNYILHIIHASTEYECTSHVYYTLYGVRRPRNVHMECVHSCSACILMTEDDTSFIASACGHASHNGSLHFLIFNVHIYLPVGCVVVIDFFFWILRIFCTFPIINIEFTVMWIFNLCGIVDRWMR